MAGLNVPPDEGTGDCWYIADQKYSPKTSLVSSSLSSGCNSGTSALPSSSIALNTNDFACVYLSSTLPDKSSTAHLVAMMICPLFFDMRVKNVDVYQSQMPLLIVSDDASCAFLIGSSIMPRSIFLPVNGPPTP